MIKVNLVIKIWDRYNWYQSLRFRCEELSSDIGLRK